MASRTETPVGRDRERSDIEALLEAGARWVTVWGPAGAGKSTLLGAVADGAQERGFDEVLACTLEGVTTLERFFGRISELLADLPAAAKGGSRPRQLGAALETRGRALLVLDGFEGLADLAGETLELWLDLAPELSILLASRRRCDSPREHSYELEPLSAEDAAELFVARFMHARPKQDLPDPILVERVVQALDGLPLAIEVAASTLALLGPAEVPVSEILHVEAGRGRQSLSRVLELSYRLLSEPQRQLLAQLSVFEREFSLADVEAVARCDQESGGLLPPLYALRELALLRPSSGGRLALLSTVRAFALEKLTESGRLEETRLRHAEHFLRRHASPEAIDERLGALEHVVRVRAEGWLRDTQLALIALEPALERQGRSAALTRLADRAVEWADALELWEPHTACVLRARGVRRRMAGQLEEATLDFERAMEIVGDSSSHTAARTATELAVTHLAAGRVADAQRGFDRALELAGQCTERTCEAEACVQLANSVSLAGDYDRAQELRARAWQLAKEAGDRHLAARAAASLAVESLTRGDLASFEHVAFESLRELRELGDVHGAAILTCNIGVSHAVRGRMDEAIRSFREAARQSKQVGDVANEASAMLNLAWAEQEQQPTAGGFTLEAAHDLARQARVASIELLASAGLALGHAANGRQAQYQVVRERAHEAMGRLDIPCVRSAARLRLLAADLAAAKRGHPPPGVRSEVQRALAHEHEPGMLVASARRLLERVQDWAPDAEITATRRTGDMIAMATDCEWFRPPGGDWVDLRRRKALRHIVSALVTAGGGVLGSDDLVRVGWPGEKILPKAAQSRVHVAISTLRKLGLPVVRIDDKGYAIDPAYPVVTGYAVEVRFEPTG